MYTFISDEELKSFIASAVINTAEAASLLNCTRQNIDDLVLRNKLVPIKIYPRDKLFLRSEVEARVK